MDTRQSRLLKEIEKEAVRIFWEESFKGKAYGSRHLFRVNTIAGHLLKKEGGDEFIILASAWAHDVSLAEGDDHDPNRVALSTRNFLTRFKDLSEEEIDGIVECAMGHEVGCKGLSLEARIVHDADVVDKSGILGVVRHAWKVAILKENRILNKRGDTDKLYRHLKERESKVFTDTARKWVKALNQSRELFFKDKAYARETIACISRLAHQGFSTDEISKKLEKRGDHPINNSLKRQLNLRFLQC